MNPLQWIPNALKAVHELLKDVKKELGGGWAGQIAYVFGLIIFALAFFAFMMWASKPIYDNFSETLSHFNISIKQVDLNIPSSLFPNMLLALLITIVEFVFLAGVAFVIAAFFATFTSLVFSPFTTRRIDNIFAAVLPIVKKNQEINPTQENKVLLDDTTKLFERWQKSKFNKFIRRTTTKKERERFDRTKL